MLETRDKNIIKSKKTDLVNALDNLSIIVLNKIKSKDEEISNIKKQPPLDLDYIAKYKTEKNKEFDLLKAELNSIVGDIDNIIKNITEQ